MKKYLTLGLIALGFAAVSEAAATYDFSYTFANGIDTTTGKLTGVGDGLGGVTDVNVQSLFIDGLQIQGPIIGSEWIGGFFPGYTTINGPAGSAYVSSDLLQSNFNFLGVGGNSWFSFNPTALGVTPQLTFFKATVVSARNSGVNPAVQFVDLNKIGMWTFTKETPVVGDNEVTFALLMVSFVGLAGLRRKLPRA